MQRRKARKYGRFRGSNVFKFRQLAAAVGATICSFRVFSKFASEKFKKKVLNDTNDELQKPTAHATKPNARLKK